MKSLRELLEKYDYLDLGENPQIFLTSMLMLAVIGDSIAQGFINYPILLILYLATGILDMFDSPNHHTTVMWYKTKKDRVFCALAIVLAWLPLMLVDLGNALSKGALLKKKNVFEKMTGLLIVCATGIMVFGGVAVVGLCIGTSEHLNFLMFTLNMFTQEAVEGVPFSDIGIYGYYATVNYMLYGLTVAWILSMRAQKKYSWLLSAPCFFSVLWALAVGTKLPDLDISFWHFSGSILLPVAFLALTLIAWRQIVPRLIHVISAPVR